MLGQKRKASRRPEKNAGSVFEQRNALARLRAHLMDEVRNRAGRACHGLALASFRSDRVPCAATILKLLINDFVSHIKKPGFPRLFCQSSILRIT
ncbi:hypothetical protein F3I27_05765 [Pantoea sp. Bo_2]|uniref:Uncharacterized protein n=1 Tax=Candidatus Pantoea gossypiicola TaxID=2608008 RepID=A0AB34CM05_9GAMM|nr:hypothetical protein F3I59_02015 [Pantoea sp. VH_8]KAA5937767.1 hypothetical protein F3I58_02040 [Pantoea sp. VH_4]KAA5950447.1 hypothetical protein F3I57_02490 [Pantoea sp. VH_3]KAA5955819.1 hypothetical protein F3I56_04220 [Pantoea sp. VH_25]KAA5960017.1 hypothetical protein F3I55_02440 [Pantoea sp. VH_24]KAA5963644.1 hypothetical protein F3I53_02515 [Pantoea sp. VH_16]KAA5967818.1 hypothetical protein F3I54_02930 [Pantoea sp. VH_18]KAA5985528.1 hypothetical protein F3I48_02045 [Pantoea